MNRQLDSSFQSALVLAGVSDEPIVNHYRKEKTSFNPLWFSRVSQTIAAVLPPAGVIACFNPLWFSRVSQTR